MAITSITNTKLTRNVAVEAPIAVAVDATLGAKIDFSNKEDGKILLLISNAHATVDKTATIAKGNSVQGVEDYTVTIPATKEYAIVIESGKFKNVSGDYKDYVIVTGESTDIKVRAIELA